MLTATLTRTLQDAIPLTAIDIPGNPHANTRHRWVHHGVLNSAGQRVKLAAWKRCGRLVTTPAAVEAFLLALNGDAPAADADDLFDAEVAAECERRGI